MVKVSLGTVTLDIRPQDIITETMRRAMARQAEAERDQRAKVIHARGEYEAAENLGQAGGILEQHPAPCSYGCSVR
jgi:regulator of protease activity HflC (stomatin/prohibitin superfamily)